MTINKNVTCAVRQSELPKEAEGPWTLRHYLAGIAIVYGIFFLAAFF